MNLRTKILLIILTVSFIMFGFIIGYISLSMEKTALNGAKKNMEIYAASYANAMSAKFDFQIGICETYINAISDYSKYPLEQRKIEDAKIGLKIMRKNPQILAVWSSWVYSTIDSTWNFDYGRQSIGMYRSEGEIKPFKLVPKELNGEDIHPNYKIVKATHESLFSEPYKGVFESGDTDSLSMVSLLFPILNNGTFNGMGGLDLDLNYFSNLINEIQFPFKKGYVFFVSNKGKLVAFKDSSLIGKPISSYFKKADREYRLTDKIENGRKIIFETKDKNGEVVVAVFHPIKFKGIKKTWAIGVLVPKNVMLADSKKEYSRILIMGLVGLFFFLIIAVVLSGYITKPLIKIRKVLERIARGEILKAKKIESNSKDEIGEIINATNSLIDKMRDIANFSYEMGKGNLHYTYTVSNENDLLGNAILEMQSNLIAATQENDKRREEDRKITWTTAGLAKFSELLRQNSSDVEEFSYSIISNLVEYLEANQGAIFLINDKNKNNMFIEKKGAYAYSNRKYDEQRFEMGVGLVGRCILEKQTIYMTDIPKDYITITSGLGGETPKCLILVPLKYNDVIFGVIEIASFKNIEDYQIAFLEKIGESIASSISGIKINSQTSKLLDESQMQSEMLSSQEEEMRQNLEEMRATQEQLQDAIEQSKETERELTQEREELKKSLDAHERLFDSVSYPICYKDVNGKYLSCNEAYAEILAFDKNEIIGRTDFQFLNYEDAQKIEELEKIVIKEKKNVEQKILFTTKAGHVFNGLQNKKVLYDKSNRIMGSITVLIPINVIDMMK